MTARRDVMHPPHLQLHKRAAKQLVQAAGGVEAAEMSSRRSRSQLSAYGVVNAPEFMPSDVIEDLESITHGQPGHPVYTRMLARKQGYALVPLPRGSAKATDWSCAIGLVSKEVSEVIHPVCLALADGAVTADEIATSDIRGRIAEAQERLADLDALCLQALEEGQ